MFQDSYLLSLVVLDDIVLAKNVLKICSDDDVTASNQGSISEMLLSSPFLRRSSDNTISTETEGQVSVRSDAQKEMESNGLGDSNGSEKHSCLLLGLPHDITEESLIDFLDPYTHEILGHTRFHQFQYVENIPTILHSLLSVVIEFKSDWAKYSFVNTYNNLVFPVSGMLLAPIVVLPLVGEGIVFEQILGEYEQTFQNCDINLDVIHTYPIEMTVIPMPMCVQCLYRLKSTSSGIYENTGSPPSPLRSGEGDGALTKGERRERSNALEHTMKVDMTLSKKQCRSCMIISQYLQRGLDMERSDGTPQNKGHVAIRDTTSNSSSTAVQQEHHSVVWQCSATRPRCDLAKNIWVCLTCSHTGCGRYTKQHAKTHFHQSGHPFSLELASGRIWDYFQDMFVHNEGQDGHYRGGHDFLGTRGYNAINASDPREMDEGHAAVSSMNGKRLSTDTDGYSDDYLGSFRRVAGNYMSHYDNDPFYSESATARTSNPWGHSHARIGERAVYGSPKDDTGLIINDGGNTSSHLLSPGVNEYDTYLLDSSIQHKLDVVKTEYDLLTRAQIEQMDMNMEKSLARETLRALDANFRQDDEDSLPSRSTDPGQAMVPSSSTKGRPSEEEERLLNRMVERDLEQIEATKIDISLFESQTQMKLQQVYEGEIILKKYKRQNEELIKRINDLKAQELAVKERYASLQLHIEHTRTEIQAHIVYMTGSDALQDNYGLGYLGSSQKQEQQSQYRSKQQQQREERESSAQLDMEGSSFDAAEKDDGKAPKSAKGKKFGKDGKKKRFY